MDDRFDPAGYERELVEMLQRDILQKNPSVKWDSIAGIVSFQCF